MPAQVEATTIAGEAPALLFQVRVHHIFHGMSQEARAHFSELFCGVGGVELQAWDASSFGIIGRVKRINLELPGNCLGSGFG